MHTFKISASEFNASNNNNGAPVRNIFLRNAAGNTVLAASVAFTRANAQIVAATLPPPEFGVKALIYGAFPASFVIGTEQQSKALTFNSCPSDQPGTALWPATLSAAQAILVTLD